MVYNIEIRSGEKVVSMIIFVEYPITFPYIIINSMYRMTGTKHHHRLYRTMVNNEYVRNYNYEIDQWLNLLYHYRHNYKTIIHMLKHTCPRLIE